MPCPPPEHPHLRLLKGNPGKRRARVPPEPTHTPGNAPPPPRHLHGYAREAWLELAPELHRLNLLTTLDLGPFSVYCAAYATWRQAEEARASGRIDDRDHRRLSTGQSDGTHQFAGDERHAALRGGVRVDAERAAAAQRDQPAATAVKVRWVARIAEKRRGPSATASSTRVAHPTRFERVAFAFGGQRLDPKLLNSSALYSRRESAQLRAVFHLETSAKLLI